MHSCSFSNTQGQVKDNNAVIVPSPDASNKAIVRLLEWRKQACVANWPFSPPALCPSVTYCSIVCSVMDLHLCVWELLIDWHLVDEADHHQKTIYGQILLLLVKKRRHVTFPSEPEMLMKWNTIDTVNIQILSTKVSWQTWQMCMNTLLFKSLS